MNVAAIRNFANTTDTLPNFNSQYKEIITDEFEIDDRDVLAYQMTGNSDCTIPGRSPTTRKSQRTSWRGSIQKIQYEPRWRAIRYWGQDLWHATIHDLKHAPWGRTGRRFFSHVCPAVTIAVLLAWVVLAQLTLGNGIESGLCHADGNFSLSADRYNPWKRTSIFAINLGFGDFPFGIAKLIDIVWDVVVGRGGQAVLAILTYQVFTKSMMYTMETCPISQETFKALTFRNDTVPGVLVLIRFFLTSKGTRARFIMFWMILGAIFVLLIPTWVSAMTGYTAKIEPFIQIEYGNQIRAADFLPVMYTVHDGQRIGLTPDYQVTAKWSGIGMSANPFAGDNDWFGCDIDDIEYEGDLKDSYCPLMWVVSIYFYNYTVFTDEHTASVLYMPNRTNITLNAESGLLNITAHLYDTPHYIYSLANRYFAPIAIGHEDEIDDRLSGLEYNHPLYFHASSNTTYNLAQLNENGICQQIDDITYKWGFSYLLLWFFTIALLLWAIVTWSIYLDAYFNSRLDVSKRDLGLERAILDISIAMQKKFDLEEIEMCHNNKIERAIRNATISYIHLPLDSLPPTRATQLALWWRSFRIKTFLWSEKWWLLALLVFTMFLTLGYTSGNWYRFWHPAASAFPVVGVIWALALGRKSRSRWLAFASCFVVFVIVSIAV